MKVEQSENGKVPGGVRMPRASVSFPPRLYRALDRIAQEKKVSVAWVVRDAAEKYVAGQQQSIDGVGQGG